MVNQSVYPVNMAVPAYPQGQAVSRPTAWQIPQQPRSPTVASQPALPKPTVRAKGDDADSSSKSAIAENRFSMLAMPSPEQLGIVQRQSKPGDGADWTQTRRRLERLGAISFQMEKMDRGGFRFLCLLPTGKPGCTHRVEAVAASEAEAIRMVLLESEDWALRRQ